MKEMPIISLFPSMPLAVFFGGLLILSEPAAELGAGQTGHGTYAGIVVHAPDAFYDPPADVPKRPGVLLRSERLKDVALPAVRAGIRNSRD